ncbi:uncharacterized protein [Nicotiana tomentosiformis]|uniref:uncharacterized protein n=1 Tax=Nicotiana tomentosiformis TaxID=4098 RepID=UPI00388C7B4A
MGRGTAQPASSAATSSAAAPPARGPPTPARCGAARGGEQSSRGHSRFYAKRGCQAQMLLQILSQNPEQLHEPFYVSTPVGEPIVAVRVYWDCVVTVHGWDTMSNAILLGMVDFDVIMGMEWLYSYFSKLDC